MDIFSRIMQCLESSHKKETLNHLRGMSERQLVDCGFSPYLVSKGIKAWPWRESSLLDEAHNPDNGSQEELMHLHIKKLQAYSDVELADLGMCRGSIEESVRKGRPGIERTTTDRAA